MGQSRRGGAILAEQRHRNWCAGQGRGKVDPGRQALRPDPGLERAADRPGGDNAEG